MKQIKFTFSKGGSVIATLLEDKAPVSCKVIWDALEKPLHECTMVSKNSGQCIYTDYVPNFNNVKLPPENLVHFAEMGDVATVCPAEYRELTVKGFVPCILCWPLRNIGPHKDLYNAPMHIDHEDDDHVMQLFRRDAEETMRGNVFAKVREEDWETLFEIGKRHRYYGIEDVIIERVAE